MCVHNICVCMCIQYVSRCVCVCMYTCTIVLCVCTAFIVCFGRIPLMMYVCLCSGKDVPKPFVNFDEIGLHEVLVSNIGLCHYSKPTPVQKWAIPISMNGRDLMACAQTGVCVCVCVCVCLILLHTHTLRLSVSC